MAINYPGVLAAAAAAWLFGALYYGLLGKRWMEAQGKLAQFEAGPRKLPVAPMVISFVAELVMAFLLAGLITHLGGPSIKSGLLTGFFIWLGFVATTVTVNHAYQQAKPIWTIIDIGHWLGVLLIEGLVIGAIG